MSWINHPRIEDKSSHQEHANLLEKPYEPEFCKESFYRPATQLHHRHPPTGWLIVKNRLRPHAFDTRNSLDVAVATESGKWTKTVDSRI